MGMNRAQKQAEIEALNARFEEHETIIVTHYSGLTVAELSELRAEARKEGVTVKVTKNSLAKLALKGTKFEGASDLFSGPTAVASAIDAVAPAKVIQKFAKTNDKLIIIGGAMGAEILDEKGVEALSKMPSLDDVRATIAGIIMAPASKIASAVAAPGSKVAGAVKAAGEKVES